MLAQWLKDHFQRVWACLFVLCALPALAVLVLFLGHGLGANPLEFVLHTTGRSALALLVLTLCITPLRRGLTRASRFTQQRFGKRLSDWNWLIRLRRPLGLWSFAYGSAHAWVFAHFDLDYDWGAALGEAREKPYLLAGLCALLLLWLLAATSPHAMVRRLGRQWRRLHRLVYLAAVLALLHFWWLVKPGLWTPWPETLALAGLLGYRAALFAGLLERWDGFDGQESSQRPTKAMAPAQSHRTT